MYTTGREIDLYDIVYILYIPEGNPRLVTTLRGLRFQTGPLRLGPNFAVWLGGPRFVLPLYHHFQMFFWHDIDIIRKA